MDIAVCLSVDGKTAHNKHPSARLPGIIFLPANALFLCVLVHISTRLPTVFRLVVVNCLANARGKMEDINTDVRTRLGELQLNAHHHS